MDQTTRQRTEPDVHRAHPAGSSREAAIADLGQAALVTDDVSGVFSLAMDLLCEVLGIEYAKVLHQSLPDEPFVLMAGRGWRKHVRVGETTVPCDRGSQAGYTLTSNQPIVVEDWISETRFVGSQLLTDHGVVSGMSVAIRGKSSPYGVVGVHSVHPRRFTPEERDFLRSVASILGITIANERVVEQLEQRSRYEKALAECAQALLASSGEDRIEHALQALLTATEATCVFLERNVVDPELGFCSQAVAEAEELGTPNQVMERGYWDLVPWERMPSSRRILEKGLPFVLIPEELDQVEFDLYAAGPFPVKAELNIPILVDDEWAGIIGLSDHAEARHWEETDVSLVTAAAQMMGAFWERDAARQRLEEMNRAKDSFLATVSHELRTPLTAVVGFGQILSDAPKNLSKKERAELLEAIVGQGTDLTNIVSDLLVAAKADVDRLNVILVPVNLRAQAAQALESFEPSSVAHIELAGDSIGAIGDPDRVRQIVRNLISNALRYGGDEIRVKVCEAGTTANVIVCDDGTAIPDEDRERIFQPYQRAHNAPGLSESLGLGLAISRQLAQLMGGDLTYRYKGGESIFELSLPRKS